MKKTIIVIMIGLAIVMTACNYSDDLDYINDKLGLNLSEEDMIYNKSDEGGWFGDGLILKKFKIKDNETKNKITRNKEWNKKPKAIINALLYGYETKKTGCASFVSDENYVPYLPHFKNAYYFFENKQDKNRDSLKILNAPSLDFIIAVYDLDEDIFYYCEYDS